MESLGRNVRLELSRFGPQEGLAEIVEAWTAAVGENVARNAWPAQLGRDGTLRVHTTDSIWAFELGHRAVELAERLGVPKVAFVPGALPTATTEPPPVHVPAPTPAEAAEAASVADAIESEELRDSVRRAVMLGLAPHRSDRPV